MGQLRAAKEKSGLALAKAGDARRPGATRGRGSEIARLPDLGQNQIIPRTRGCVRGPIGLISRNIFAAASRQREQSVTDEEIRARQESPGGPGPRRTRADRSRRGAGWLALGLGAAIAAAAATIGAGSGCQNRAGMSCQQPGDCNPGLLCNKPPAAGPQSYGICEPGLHGIGEICVRSLECDPGLVCSTELGQPSDDGWHGVCQAAAVDAASRDFSQPPDLSAPADLVALDGGADL